MARREESAHAFRGRYRLLELVGEGANARVYTADDLTLHRRVAVKILREELVADAGFKQRFEREMRAASLLSFPRLLPVYDWGVDPLPYLVTEHLTGGSLADMLAAGYRLSPSQAVEVGFELARALANIHRAGGAYGGLTTSSIMFDSQARVFVTDLGVAASLGVPGLEALDAGGDRTAEPGAATVEAEPGHTDAEPTAAAVDVEPTAVDPDVEPPDSEVADAEPADPGPGDAQPTDPEGAEGAEGAEDRVAEPTAVDRDADADQADSAGSDPWGIATDSWDTEVWDIETWGLDDTGRVDVTPVAVGQPDAESSAGSRHSALDQQRDVYDLALLLNESVTGVRSAPGRAGDESLPASILLGPLNTPLERATAVDPADRLDAAGLVEELLRVARLLPRPDPLPIVPVDAGMARPTSDSRPPMRVASAPTELAQSLGLARPTLSEIPLDDVLRRRWPGLVLAVALVLGGGAAAVWAWIDARPDTVAVPELAGQDRLAAAQTLSEHGWEVQEVLVRESGTRHGQVVGTEPSAGAELGEGSAVDLFVSLGEPLVALDFDVYGHTVLDATEMLKLRGLAMEGQVPVNDEAVPLGLVVGLDVDDGIYELEPGSVVGLRVSAGPAPRTVPEVPEDRTPIAAVEALYAARLKPTEVEEFSAEVLAGEVIGYRPASGGIVDADSLVEIRVSKGPEPQEPEPEESEGSGEAEEPGEAVDS